MAGRYQSLALRVRVYPGNGSGRFVLQDHYEKVLPKLQGTESLAHGLVTFVERHVLTVIDLNNV